MCVDALPAGAAGRDARRRRRMHPGAVRRRHAARLVPDRPGAGRGDDRPRARAAAVRAAAPGCGSGRSTAVSGIARARRRKCGRRRPRRLPRRAGAGRADDRRIPRRRRARAAPGRRAASQTSRTGRLANSPGDLRRGRAQRSFADILIMGDAAVAQAAPVREPRDRGLAAPLPVDAIARAAARAMFPRQACSPGRGCAPSSARAAPLTDADPMRSPEPPEEIWRVG